LEQAQKQPRNTLCPDLEQAQTTTKYSLS
jgi:hypothetical protein